MRGSLTCRPGNHKRRGCGARHGSRQEEKFRCRPDFGMYSGLALLMDAGGSWFGLKSAKTRYTDCACDCASEFVLPQASVAEVAYNEPARDVLVRAFDEINEPRLASDNLSRFMGVFTLSLLLTAVE